MLCFYEKEEEAWSKTKPGWNMSRVEQLHCSLWDRYSKYSSKDFLCSAGLSWITFERKFVQVFKRADFIKHLYMQ